MSAKTVKGTVIKTHLNKRIGAPDANAEKFPRALRPNEEVEIIASVTGSMYEDSNMWYVTSDGAFIWSGSVRVLQPVKHYNKRLLVTCDDYGVVKEIDAGIIDLLKKGKINGTEAFVNFRPKSALDGPPNLDSLRTLKKLQNDPNVPHFDVGLHLTITSGRPVLPASEVPALCEKANGPYAGQFLSNINRGDRNCMYPLSGFEIEQLQNELKAQVIQFERVFGKVNHLSSHHHSLTYFENHYKATLELAKRLNVPIRSHVVRPKIGNWGARFKNNNKTLGLSDRDRVFSNVDRQADPAGTIDAADFITMKHFHAGAQFSDVNRKKLEEKAKKQRKKLKGFLKKQLEKPEPVFEVIIHAMQGDESKSQSFFEAYMNTHYDYHGINPGYFEGRVLEYLSLMGIHYDDILKKNYDWGPWIKPKADDDVPLPGIWV